MFEDYEPENCHTTEHKVRDSGKPDRRWTAQILWIQNWHFITQQSEGEEEEAFMEVYLYFLRRPSHQLCFLSCRPFVVNATFSTGLLGCQSFDLSPGLGSWQLEFKSLIILIVGFRNFFCCLVWAVDLGAQITDEGRSLHIGSFCPAMLPIGAWNMILKVLIYLTIL